MIKSYMHQSIILLLAGLLAVSGPVAAAVGDGDYLWKSGRNQYIKYAELDTDQYGPNDHPAQLNPRQIVTALEALQFRSEDFFATDDDLKPVFSVSEARRLGEHLARGLREARPDQDITFVVAKSVPQLMFFTDTALTSGRAFYKDGRLNIIIGKYEMTINEEFERVYDSSGQVSPYTFTHGSRTGRSGDIRQNLANVAGIENKVVNNDPRQDWFVIDVPTAAAAVARQKQEAQRGGGGGVDSEEARQMRLEAARMKKEQRELKLEMARMREQMKSLNNGGSAGGETVEERLATLERLHDEGLVTDEEYEAKRREILGDI